MQNSNQISLLNKQIRDALSLPLSEIGEAALTSFLALPNVDTWYPNNLYLQELSCIFDIGLPIALLGNNLSADSHKSEIGKAIKSRQGLPPSLWSEVQVAALLTNWGETPSFVKTKAWQIPDIEVQSKSKNGLVLDVEVTRGEIRLLHKATKDGLASFESILNAGDVNWNVVCFFADASNQDDLNACLDAAVVLRPDEFKENPQRWAVRAIDLNHRDDVVGAEMVKLFSPDWWQINEPSYFVNSTLIGKDTSPIVSLRTMIPITSYMNPIRRKADNGQQRAGHSYLIALDTSEMMGGHKRIANELHDYFPNWDHVSGVMIFDARFWTGVECKDWIVSIHANPYASLPLPANIMRLADGKQHSIQFNLSR